MATEETHQATFVEIFFDVVFVFALTGVISFMGRPPAPLRLAQGLLLLLLFWFAWSCYTWLGNQSRADVGPVRAGIQVAMAAIFVAALVIPDAWGHGDGFVNPPLIVALTYVAVRGIQLVLYFGAAGGDRQLLITLACFASTTVLAWTPLVLGAVVGGTTQTLLWVAALVIDYGGAWATSTFRDYWVVRSPSHFTQRHAVVLIIALGESLVAAGAGAGTAVARGPILLAALLGVTITIGLWWLYFGNVAAAASRALAGTRKEERGSMAGTGYTVAHIPLIAGIIYLAVGIEQVLAEVAHNRSGHPAGRPLDWVSTATLYGGAALYLAGRILFLRATVRSAPRAQMVVTGTAILLIPAAKALPALAALGLLTAFVAVLVGYERLANRRQEASARGRVHPSSI